MGINAKQKYDLTAVKEIVLCIHVEPVILIVVNYISNSSKLSLNALRKHEVLLEEEQML